MLHQLHISGLGVIDDLDLELHPGLNVLTGETGAGKTMVTVGLALVSGSRASAQLVRSGATSARVQARFDAPDADDGWAEDGEVLLARSVGADGRGGARIGGQLTTASALSVLGGRLLEIHGQHHALRLLDAATQTAFLDRAAGSRHHAAVEAMRSTWEQLAHAREVLRELSEAMREREREADLLAYQVREIESVGPVEGDTEALTAEETRLGHVERLLELAGAVETAVGGEGERPTPCPTHRAPCGPGRASTLRSPSSRPAGRRSRPTPQSSLATSATIARGWRSTRSGSRRFANGSRP